jgi:hypothetical protein
LIQGDTTGTRDWGNFIRTRPKKGVPKFFILEQNYNAPFPTNGWDTFLPRINRTGKKYGCLDAPRRKRASCGLSITGQSRLINGGIKCLEGFLLCASTARNNVLSQCGSACLSVLVLLRFGATRRRCSLLLKARLLRTGTGPLSLFSSVFLGPGCRGVSRRVSTYGL